MSEILDELREDIAERRSPGSRLRHALLESEDPALLRKAGRIAAGLSASGCDLPPLRVSILSTATVGAFEHMLRAALLGAGALPIVDCAAYGAFDLTLAAGGLSGHGAPDVVACVLAAEYFLGRDWDTSDTSALAARVESRVEELSVLLETSLGESASTFVVHTVPLPSEVRDTFISARARSALALIWYRLNGSILELAERHHQVVAVDLVSGLADAPIPARDDRLHRYADLPYTDGALLILAREVRRVAQARAGLSRKVLALDLDNTLWGGVLGEVGAEGVELGGLYPGNCYLGLQRSVQRLRDQGVVLVLASKNDAELVDDALNRHPESLLRTEDFSVTAVNWSRKSENLRGAATALGLSTDSFVFMDDSPFEREEVAQVLPEVATVAADVDPAHLTRALLRHGWFDVPELTDTDRRRPQLYRARALRHELASQLDGVDSLMRALSIEVTAERVSGFTVGRVAQLAARTNQFNLTGRRHSEAAISAMAGDPHWLVAAFSSSDRFGDEGIVGGAWVDCGGETWRVDNLVLSCRVLGRGIEFAIVDWLARRAAEAGADTLQGEFLPSGKNRRAAQFWVDAGFTPGATENIFVRDARRPPERTTPWITFREKGIA